MTKRRLIRAIRKQREKTYRMCWMRHGKGIRNDTRIGKFPSSLFNGGARNIEKSNFAGFWNLLRTMAYSFRKNTKNFANS